MRIITVLFLGLLGASVSADAVLMNNGERYIGEVTDLGNSLRIKNEAHPEGLVVKKSDVKTVYPKPEAMIEKLRRDIEKAKARYEAGKNSANPNAEMKAALELLFDPEVEVEDAIQIYPDFRTQFADVQTSIHELRKLCRDAQVSGKPPPGPDRPDPKPEPPADGGKVQPEAPANPNELYLAGPADAKPADLEKAAKAMAARATTHGFEGVTAKVVRRGDFSVIQVTSKNEMSKDMRWRLTWYGGKLGRHFDIRFESVMTPGQTEQFPAPSLADLENGKARAPAGMKWFRTGEDKVVVLADKYVLTRKDLGKKEVREENEVWYQIVTPVAKTMNEDNSLVGATATVSTVWFVSDGVPWSGNETCFAFEKGGAKRTYLRTGSTDENWKTFLNVHDHPLPFTVTEVNPR
ncbi:MAG: hypothetical protein AAB074_03165 [Planctomycetota bacterium]